MTTALNGVRRWAWLFLAALGVILFLLLWLSPSERTLGQIVTLVYLHGALVRTAMLLFAISLPVNLVALLGGRSSWLAWGKVLIWTALAIWLIHTLFSMITTYAAWGVFIAWFEPRTRFTFTVAVAGLIIVAIAYLVDDGRFSALAFVVLAGLTLVLAPRLGAVQHPLNAIGSSPSNAIRAYYTAIWVVTLLMSGFFAIWLRGRLAPAH